ncbi:MAG: hypothetical protein MZV64_35745 [Ignavibacteriales bacterium]|nr:hypothetical protein [Ignavibacteriales bacterium]
MSLTGNLNYHRSGIQNGWQLVAQAERAGARAKYYGIAPDDEELTLTLIIQGLLMKMIL